MYRTVIILSILLYFVSCIDQPTPEPIGNLPPVTHLWLMPDDTLRTTTSRQHVHWWGDDPDGFVVGYEWSFDSITWNWTTRTDSVFHFSLQQQDTLYTFSVRAVDNDGARDPDPPMLTIPVKNSPPSVEFRMGTDVPETTFTVATFSWHGTDPDGDETIVRYLWALNDTTEWNELSGDISMLTVRAQDGLQINNTNVFYLKAQDIAGTFSNTAWMPGNPAPDNPDREPNPDAIWFVREPVGDLLVIDDYALIDGADIIYKTVLDTLANGRFKEHSIWDIRRGRTGTQRGTLVPAFINPTFIETLKLFKYVIWYGDNSPSYSVAQIAIPPYLESGGKVLMTVSFAPGEFDPREQGLVDFAPVDSVAEQDVGFVPPETIFNPTSAAQNLGYPTLVRDDVGTSVGGVRSLTPSEGAIPLYRIGPNPDRWEGEPLIAVKSGDNSMVFFGIRISRMNGHPDKPETRNLGKLLYKILIDEFGS